MKTLLSATRLSLLLAVTAPQLGACVAAPLDDRGEAAPERVGEGEDALTVWQPDTPIPGQQSQDGPALATYNYSVAMVHRGKSDNNLYMSIFDGNGDYTWSTNTPISGKSSKATVALTQHADGKLHLAYLCGSGYDVCHSTYLGGTSWAAAETLFVGSSASPALATDPITKELVLVTVYPFGPFFEYTRYDGTWHNSDILYDNGNIDIVANKPPALAVHQGRIHMVYEGGDGQLRHQTYNGTSWDPSTIIPNKIEQSSPTLASYGGLLYLMHRGAYTNQIYWSSSATGSAWTLDVSLPQGTTQSSPALATSGLLLVMAHNGASSPSLSYATFQP